MQEQIPSQQDHLATLAYLDKQVKRGQIAREVADADSIVGTTSDTSHLLLVELITLIDGLSKATTLAEMRAVASQGQTRLGTLANKVLNREIQFPYQGKNIERVYQEIAARATGVTTILTSSE
ncbi:hypothetical protein [Pseudoalteromonas peptidolytica]|uniref:Uncharacterized protein n=1 Tax=Pseudoalteromonas peptidolytica F12-50-A1 TaxID=1315280 RepID=A0A8I0T564_9GAMM|nr:hypothetical protein [Pseudoalteromonas peptidolytica]MBE0347042.1 hypothetical protein [Pseudoalteromonas peptidolytica F12-50-A1]NLR14096.1 hypothetical protein [Pseudoalteromonas peptidolytica]